MVTMNQSMWIGFVAVVLLWYSVMHGRVSTPSSSSLRPGSLLPLTSTGPGCFNENTSKVVHQLYAWDVEVTIPNSTTTPGLTLTSTRLPPPKLGLAEAVPTALITTKSMAVVVRPSRALTLLSLDSDATARNASRLRDHNRLQVRTLLRYYCLVYFTLVAGMYAGASMCYKCPSSTRKSKRHRGKLAKAARLRHTNRNTVGLLDVANWVGTVDFHDVAMIRCVYMLAKHVVFRSLPLNFQPLGNQGLGNQCCRFVADVVGEGMRKSLGWIVFVIDEAATAMGTLSFVARMLYDVDMAVLWLFCVDDRVCKSFCSILCVILSWWERRPATTTTK
jgi:hypothetical protein